MSSRSGSTSDPAPDGGRAWLVRGTSVLAAVETRRRVGPLRGAVLVRPPTLIETLTTPERLDVAHCRADGDKRSLTVRRLGCLAPYRAMLVARGGLVILAPAGSFERWALSVGDTLAVEGGRET